MSGHLPTLTSLRGAFSKAEGLLGELTKRGLPMFTPGSLIRTDGLPVDKTLADLRLAYDKALAGGNGDKAGQIYALHSRTASISDLTEDLYERFTVNPASIANWFPPLVTALQSAPDCTFSLPATSIWRLPIELAQYLRMPYEQANEVSRQLFNKIASETLDLNPNDTYFLKTGSFSSKFEFANARCTEPLEAGEYFHVINNAAMMVGAGNTVDLCAREYIEPADGTPTIYHGMPLRTELRAFVDLGFYDEDGHGLLGITPYWHPSVMTRALALAEQQPGMEHIHGDYDTYQAHLSTLTAGFDSHREEVAHQLGKLLTPLRNAGLRGAWSIDIMIEGSQLWIIDAAPMRTSALTEQLLVTDEYALVNPSTLKPLANEIVIDDFDSRNTAMTPRYTQTVYRYQWNHRLC